MPSNRRRTGALGERIAREHLERAGYRIIETNFRCREGEIDIIAQEGEYLVFTEVRTKRSTDFGTPEESLTGAKREKLIELANIYLQRHQIETSLWRIDVVAVELGAGDRVSRVELFRNAVCDS